MSTVPQSCQSVLCCHLEKKCRCSLPKTMASSIKSLTMHDILAILEEDDSHAKVYIEPTDTGLLTDEDSADEDDSGLIDNLSGRQLTSNAEAVFHDGRRTTEDDCEPQLSGNDEAISHDESRTAEDDGAAHSSSPINSYKTPKWSLTRNEAIYQAMRRRFEKIMQFINFSDNPKLDTTDKYAKVRPLVRHLTMKFIEHFQPVKSLSHDEAMVEYYGKHGCKQCIRMKPIRFGYKVWYLNSDDGYQVTFDLYQGRTYEGNEVNEKVFGKCAATVLKNIDSLSEDKRSLP
ncbi:piggyBac transposable element-derived protein 2-like [Palaemon carinicauda]|uniref:piggyBac transposable element-derived protein 2-like n=1 Tax=Palaemon carinicauda TaxID=392227 RepID=UPI0035B5D25E